MPSERCPLGAGLYWDNDAQIPMYCTENCGKSMSMMSAEAHDEYDIFPDDGRGATYGHPDELLVTEDCSLQRGDKEKRIFSVTDMCEGCGMEYGAQSYIFQCEKD